MHRFSISLTYRLWSICTRLPEGGLSAEVRIWLSSMGWVRGSWLSSTFLYCGVWCSCSVSFIFPLLGCALVNVDLFGAVSRSAFSSPALSWLSYKWQLTETPSYYYYYWISKHVLIYIYNGMLLFKSVKWIYLLCLLILKWLNKWLFTALILYKQLDLRLMLFRVAWKQII
jgi:hypothetical protein